MNNIISNPKVIAYAIFGGLLPAIAWLWFWLREEDSDEKEPIGLIAMTFILGGTMVLLAIWLEKYSLNFISDKTTQIVAWASIEEILKLLAITLVVYGSGQVDRPIDYPMYFIATALGFAALENIFFLINPLQASGTVVGLITGNLRFLGSTLLHAIASGMIGSALGLAFYLKQYRAFYLLIGIIFAITLHSLFNFFIMKGSGENFLSVFGFLWVVAIINILIFEKLRRMSSYSMK